MTNERRITPACAGKTISRSTSGESGRDHPRVCGENCKPYHAAYFVKGSPPRVRGKQVCRPRLVGVFRITPAHAGKTAINLLRPQGAEDHPRACGENGAGGQGMRTQRESPPRMRGKQHLRCDSLGRQGITPAHAGKTVKNHVAIVILKDHPRACRENVILCLNFSVNSGSPPRMRGKLARRNLNAFNRRITPAHAGKTPPGGLFDKRSADHPRACGENCTVQDIVTTAGGSPPRMRGKRSGAASAGRAARITPAHAGKTAVSRRGGLRAADHPRACRENVILCLNFSVNSGSPPRMRGKLSR